MSEDWKLYTEDPNEEPYQGILNLLPSSLKDVWEDQDPMMPVPIPKSPSPQAPSGIYEGNSIPKHTKPFPFPESAPALSFMEDHEGATPTTEPEVLVNQTISSDTKFYQVQFHPFRTELYHWSQISNLSVGDYVVTEADRGYDVGRIVEEVRSPPSRESKASKGIVRIASQHEISQLSLKTEREKRAKELCQTKARELDLPMSIDGAEFQFDGKKLSFYYTANAYVDFRNLVRILFKTFGMRIWMVWHDGNERVKDVLQRSEQK
ncbi:PSP1 C-terminal conserved region family protein [Trichomonas vaginalis G3]|uniref:PSP1 C-terminal conserved region family protein n=1 Tax=Trichomonas vaginalis (strain ATCC PRA-98 / G3) TaxID=412133 RepID=A2DX00_TRIV3|nr:PSP1 C-terminal conserved region-containing protein [Trichomonas vaginalis G3]EAY15027.1 PSP1 C-terminal conserved region family protein [Trichomonas vaginalis G3]KAI5549568.1 PSP1 C-terminal conserved region-containing protein [Trichomonas vaginalis G3]|eukprot:XP_001327250.1 PSP1 C-terminal conserved region family protein [Trichomonas vaginalis G3]